MSNDWSQISLAVFFIVLLVVVVCRYRIPLVADDTETKDE